MNTGDKILEEIRATNDQLVRAQNQREALTKRQCDKLRAVEAAIVAAGDQQLAAAGEQAAAIVATREEIARAISDLEHTAVEGFAELGATFEWGFSELIYQSELNRKELKQIRKLLEAPLDTAAQELRKRAEFAYKSGWIDEALKDFREAERKNYQDFAVHLGLGNIYLFHKADLPSALACYENAGKYAEPRDRYYACLAYLHVALVHRIGGRLQEALRAAARAVRLKGDWPEALFQYAQLSAINGFKSEFVRSLSLAIEKDPGYALKAIVDDAFQPYTRELCNLLSEHLAELGGKLRSHSKQLGAFMKQAEELGAPQYAKEPWAIVSSWADFVDKCEATKAIADRRRALDALPQVGKALLACAEQVWQNRKQEDRAHESQLDLELHIISKKVQKERDKSHTAIGCFTFPAAIVMGAVVMVMLGRTAGPVESFFVLLSSIVAAVAVPIMIRAAKITSLRYEAASKSNEKKVSEAHRSGLQAHYEHFRSETERWITGLLQEREAVRRAVLAPNRMPELPAAQVDY